MGWDPYLAGTRKGAGHCLGRSASTFELFSIYFIRLTCETYFTARFRYSGGP